MLVSVESSQPQPPHRAGGSMSQNQMKKIGFALDRWISTKYPPIKIDWHNTARPKMHYRRHS